MGTLVGRIQELAGMDFDSASLRIEEFIDSYDDFPALLDEASIIPEEIQHDSTEEKLYSKATDAVLARAFRELGLKATVLRERADSADVLCASIYHDYSLVADAKAFRLSRTAKNQKDFKVNALSDWRQDAKFAVLCSPYFQYPRLSSQIYSQALDRNVCLLSWEHLSFLIKNGIRETVAFPLSCIWDFSRSYGEKILFSERKKCLIGPFADFLLTSCGLDSDGFQDFLKGSRDRIKEKGDEAISFWKSEIDRIKQLSREEAIEELLKQRRISERIAQIRKYMEGISE